MEMQPLYHRTRCLRGAVQDDQVGLRKSADRIVVGEVRRTESLEPVEMQTLYYWSRCLTGCGAVFTAHP